MRHSSQNLLIEIICGVFIFLFAYTGFSKLINDELAVALGKSTFPTWMQGLLRWCVPMMEVAVAAILFIPKYRRTGLVCSFGLLLLFTGYVAYLLSFASSIPCSCGGVISSLTWRQHLVLNLLLLLLAAIGIWLSTYHKEFIAINRTSRTPV